MWAVSKNVRTRRIGHPLLSAAFGAITLLLTSCVAPAPIDPYQVSVTPEPTAATPAADQTYRVAGTPESVPPDTTVNVVNRRSGEIVTVTPELDGSFLALINARNGDKLELTASRPTAGSAATVVYVGAHNIKNPYSLAGNWHVGQVHFHSTNSDGVNTPAQMEAAYFDAGYDFVISTDHRGTSPYFLGGDDGLTPDPYNQASGKDLLWILGSELGYGNAHMGAWGHSVRPGWFAAANLQGQIDFVRNKGGIVAMNHPENRDPGYAWEWHEEIKKTKRYSIVEAFNGVPLPQENGGKAEVNHLPEAVNLADEFYQVWWIGTDDCHDKDNAGQFDRYAVVVQTQSQTPTRDELLGALDSGDFYVRETASGPAIESITVAGNVASVKLADVASNYDVTWYKRGNEIAQRNQNVDNAASYTVRGDEGYVRIEILRLSDGKHAYSQPLFVANNADLAVSASASQPAGAEYLIDDRVSTFWKSGSATGSFIIDVGSIRRVNAITINWYRADNRHFNYRIEASPTGAFAGEETEVVRGTFRNRSALTTDFFDERTRFIRVVITGQSVGTPGSVRVSEVQVFDSSPAPTQLYIDNVQGSDGNTGLAGSPWLSFAHAKDRIRPRDVLNFVATGVPYPGGMQLGVMQGGKDADARIVFQGDPASLTEVSASGAQFGVQFQRTRFVDWRNFDMHSATTANVYVDRDSADITISNNRLHDSMRIGFLGNGKFTLINNLLYGNIEDGALIYMDGTNASIYHNVFYGNGQYGLELGGTSGVVTAAVFNNIASGNYNAAIRRGTGVALEESHNCIDGAVSGSWSGTASILGSPRFANAPGGDFRLQATSPCIDAGLDLNLPDDFLGNPRVDDPSVSNTGSPGDYSRDYVDIGAFEFQPE